MEILGANLNRVLAGFDPKWPVLNFTVAGFGQSVR